MERTEARHDEACVCVCACVCTRVRVYPPGGRAHGGGGRGGVAPGVMSPPDSLGPLHAADRVPLATLLCCHGYSSISTRRSKAWGGDDKYTVSLSSSY